ncbi:MAG TPA: twin-arginine translocase subunit TatC [Patescibacteria group bacterium]|nr:twin-arginine translocase subunit TatC [Patescibacteria group bacterium]
MRRATRNQKSRIHSRPEAQNPKIPFIEHLYELRKRLFYVALSIGLWATAAYFVQHHIVAALLRPANHQQFIYTSVGGGIDFLFRICIYTGIVFSIPVAVFQILKYLEPLIKKDAMKFMLWGSAASGILAIIGMAFGYFLGLPAALHFLLHQFTTNQVQALLTIQSYMSFVTIYMLGSALLLQLPLLLVLINRVKPLKPKKLLGFERWVILFAFIFGGIMNPSPRVQDQIMLAGPIIATYQVGVIAIWWSGRKRRRSPKTIELLKKDAEARSLRLAKFAEAQAALAQQPAIAAPVASAADTIAPSQSPKPIAVRQAAYVASAPLRRTYVNDFSPRRNSMPRGAMDADICP